MAAEGEGRRLLSAISTGMIKCWVAAEASPPRAVIPTSAMHAGRDGRDPRQASAGAVQQNKMLPLCIETEPTTPDEW